MVSDFAGQEELRPDRKIHPKLRVTVCNHDAIASGENRHFEDEITIDLGCQLTIRVSASRQDESSNDEFRTLASRGARRVLRSDQSNDFESCIQHRHYRYS